MRHVARAALATLFALVALAALVVILRRIDGALREPLPPFALAALGGGLAIAALAFRHLTARDCWQWGATACYAIWAAPSVVLLLWAAGILLPGTTATGWASFLGLLLVEEGWSWGRLPKKGAGVLNNESRPLFSEAGLSMLDGEPSQAPADIDETATQWLVRRREPDGGEAIEGWLRTGFVAGQRHAMAHLAICPPMATTPVCYAEASDGPPAQVKVGQVLPYGLRLEIKLDEAAEEPCEVLVEFSIQEQAP